MNVSAIWLAVGVIAGYALASASLSGHSEWLLLLIPCALGVIIALMAGNNYEVRKAKDIKELLDTLLKDPD